MDSTESSVSLRLASGSASFKCGADVLDVPHKLAQRSEFIANMLNQEDENGMDLPIPLSICEVKAWLADEYRAEAVDDDDSTSASEGESSEADIDRLLYLYKVRDHGTSQVLA